MPARFDLNAGCYTNDVALLGGVYHQATSRKEAPTSHLERTRQYLPDDWSGVGGGGG